MRHIKSLDQVSPERGREGMLLACGQVVLTATGRETTPFPKFNLNNERGTGRALRLVEQWLFDNALAEAEARGDDYNAAVFRAEQRDASRPQASKDSAEMYLFATDQSFAVGRPKIFRNINTK